MDTNQQSQCYADSEDTLMADSKQFTARPIIVKIGGGREINTQGIARELATLKQPTLVVLGANAIRDEVARKLDQPTQTLQSVSGYESVYSDQSAIDVIMMSYAGLVRNRFVEACQKAGVNAIGLSGLDGRLIEGQRNRGIRVREQGKTLIKRDFSGKPGRINGELLRFLLDNGYTPVISIPIADENGVAINADNDNIITVLHRQLNAKRVFQFIEAPGLLADRDDPSSLIRSLDANDLEARESSSSGRMKRKLMALRQLFEAGATELIIADGRVESPIASAETGTIIRQCGEKT